jgi:hypothetical protein
VETDAPVVQYALTNAQKQMQIFQEQRGSRDKPALLPCTKQNPLDNLVSKGNNARCKIVTSNTLSAMTACEKTMKN